MSWVHAYIGLGGNLKEPANQVRQAFLELDNIVRTRCSARSPLYRSEPLGPAGQPDYINAVVRLETELSPAALLAALQTIENHHGRERSLRWGPRTLDLDMLLYAELIQDHPHLVLPHPRLHERAFVLYPLHDIAPELDIPGRGKLKALLSQCPPMKLERLPG